MTSKIFDAFACRSIGEDASIMEVDYDVSCESDHYSGIIVGCSVLVVVWSIGVPVGLLVAMYRAGAGVGVKKEDEKQAMVAELAQLLEVHPSRLNVHISTDDNEAELEGGRPGLGSSRWTPPAGKTIGRWTVDDLTEWLGEEMEMEMLAGAVKRKNVDGEMALKMSLADWQDLPEKHGVSGLKASRVATALQLLARAQEMKIQLGAWPDLGCEPLKQEMKMKVSQELHLARSLQRMLSIYR